ncbi:MAG TPA: biotin--[acetyl-CoA-carboxylase] ligase, partial [Terriglobales bacterium]|nr:biotin--[acetyl-CoA-carboxylase] ligase [Terriglobales bacterium]
MRLLTDHAMVTVSGTKVAGEIGVSRSEIWRLVQQLRSMGVAIAGRPATGYQLERVPDLLLPDILAPLLKGTRFSEHILHFFRLGSTNAAAMHAAARGAPEGSVFLAEEQTAGRGRGGHSWHSAASTGIYCSVVLRPKLPPAEILVLSLAAGLAAADAVEHTTGLRPDLKWPNDLLIGVPAGEGACGYVIEGEGRDPSDGDGAHASMKKFCGILTELNAEVTRVRYAVVGVGINVNQAEFPAEIANLAASLRLAGGREWSRVE